MRTSPPWKWPNSWAITARNWPTSSTLEDEVHARQTEERELKVELPEARLDVKSTEEEQDHGQGEAIEREHEEHRQEGAAEEIGRAGHARKPPVPRSLALSSKDNGLSPVGHRTFGHTTSEAAGVARVLAG